MSLAFEIGARIAVVSCPKLPGEDEVVRANLLRETLLDLGQHGDRIGTVLALEIGLDSPESIRDYLATFDVGSLRVNYDPANLLVHGFDPIQGIFTLHRTIAHFHARDARKTSVSRGASEVALGAGDINWLAMIAALTASDYRGWLVIERELTDNRIEEMKRAVAFLRKMMIPT